ncbi:MAG: ferric reductase-like transmembrane domain-containing protein [Anaerolineae bacterium]|nr:ferric reductase-like transmembrane domain-containing protein [Anaerolineae bacterium]
MASEQSTSWLDRLSILFILLVAVGSAFMLVASGTLNISLTDDAKLVWHLTRSSGIIAFLLMSVSTLWGLLVSSQIVKTWSPGPVSMTLHSTASWLALLLSLTHAALLLFDDYVAYAIHEILIPFTGPYRPEAVGLGTLAFWIILIVTLSFPLKKRIGQKVWKRLHMLSYVSFALVAVHGLTAGTEGDSTGFRLLVGGSGLLVILLLGIRMGKDQAKDETASKAAPRSSRAASPTARASAAAKPSAAAEE